MRRCLCPPPLADGWATARRHLRNLHRNTQERHKRHVKDRLHFSRNWYLHSGNNYEVAAAVGHEREATENFGRYRYGDAVGGNGGSGTAPARSPWYVSVRDIQALPPLERIGPLVASMEKHWSVRGPSMHKLQLLVRTVECWEEARRLRHIGGFEQLPEEHQKALASYIDAIAHMSRRLELQHTSVVAALVRVSDVCDVLDMATKRDELLALADSVLHASEAQLNSTRPILQLPPPWLKTTRTAAPTMAAPLLNDGEYRRPEGVPILRRRHGFADRLPSRPPPLSD